MWHRGKQGANITTKRRKIKCLKPPDILRGPACNLIEQICNWHNCRFGKGYLVGKQNCERNKLGTFTWNHRLAYRGQSVNTLCGIWNNNQSGKQRIISFPWTIQLLSNHDSNEWWNHIFICPKKKPSFDVLKEISELSRFSPTRFP